MKVLVLNAKTYSVVDEKTGQVNQGVSVWYLNPKSKTNDGVVPMKLSIPVEQNILTAKVLGHAPAVFNFEFDIMPGKGNKAVMKLSDLEYVSELDLSSLI